MKPIRWEGSWIIRAPRERVYALMTDFEGWPGLMPGIVKSVRVLSRTEESVVLEGEFNLLGQRGRGRMKIRLEPPAGFTADNISEKLGKETEILRFQDIPEGTLYRWAVDAEPKGLFNRVFGRLAGPIVRNFYESTIIKPLRKAVEE